MAKVHLDLNYPPFQETLFSLSKNEQRAVLNTLRKISRTSWSQVYRDSGLKWEKNTSRQGPRGETLYSFRCGKAFRALATRQGDFLRLFSLHPDHDSAYR